MAKAATACGTASQASGSAIRRQTTVAPIQCGERRWRRTGSGLERDEIRSARILPSSPFPLPPAGGEGCEGLGSAVRPSLSRSWVRGAARSILILPQLEPDASETAALLRIEGRVSSEEHTADIHSIMRVTYAPS